MSQGDLLRRSAILIVDRDPESVRVLEQMLKRAGYRNVAGTIDLEAAPVLYRELRPDLLLVGLEMPECEGLELIETLKEGSPPRTFLPVLAVTAGISPEMKIRALLLGVDGFLAKPIDYLEMILRIRNLLEVHSLTRELQYGSALARAEHEPHPVPGRM